jgi:hypothetical protein
MYPLSLVFCVSAFLVERRDTLSSEIETLKKVYQKKGRKKVVEKRNPHSKRDTKHTHRKPCGAKK